MKFIKKNIKSIILIIVGFILILSGYLSWNFYFSKYDIFNKQEKLFLDTVKRYYDFNSNQLPKKNETREINLQELYDGNHIEALYIPKTRKLCDTNSWVRVYQNDDGTFEYTVYLKCGKYESNTDHTGPEITLNGDINTILAFGSSYIEPGVNKVVDKEEGIIDNSQVIIDSSNVDTSKVGTYKVTYTVRDKAYNKTVVTRNVIVARNLTEVAKSSTDDSNYYKGLNVNNYLLFSGMLFRIVNVNDDGSVKIVTNSSMANVNYGVEGANFDSSNIKDWLNNYFYSKLYNTDYLVKDNTWCIDDTNSVTNISNLCDVTDTSNVGLLSLIDFNNSKVGSQTYLGNTFEYWFLNRKDSRFGYIYSFHNNSLTESYDNTSLSGVRPVLVLKNDLYIISGDGTSSNPYTLGDYSSGKENDLLNTRLIGEYVSYFGMTFRISDVDKDKNIKLISLNFLQNNTTSDVFFSGYKNEDGIMKFNVNQSGNIGNTLNYQYIDYIDTSFIVDHEFYIPTYSVENNYSNIQTESFKAKIAIPMSYEMFSGVNANLRVAVNYWLLDYIDGSNAFMVNNSNGRTFKINRNDMYNENGFKLVFYVSKNTKIKSGKGTYNNPYVIK